MAAEYRETVLKVENLTVGYNGTPVIKNLSAEIRDIVGHGQVVSLLGPSGIGKTTLLRALAGLEKPSRGDISVYHEREKRLVPVERGMIGVVAQKYPLLRHRTVMGNLLLAASQRNSDKETPEERSKKYLERFGLLDHANCHPIELSGGQRQRVAIIQQLLRSEHFILMDEPFSGLDPINKLEVCKLVREVADVNELNTIIVVTHGIRDALCVSDTIWMIGRDQEKGKVIPGAYIKKPYNLVERGFAWEGNQACLPGYRELVEEIEQEYYDL